LRGRSYLCAASAVVMTGIAKWSRWPVALFACSVVLGLSLVGQGLFGHIDLLLLRGDAALRWCQGLDGFDRGYLVKSHLVFIVDALWGTVPEWQRSLMAKSI
jgi:hypothetical protein